MFSYNYNRVRAIIYELYDKRNSEVIYIGISRSKNLYNRPLEHFKRANILYNECLKNNTNISFKDLEYMQEYKRLYRLGINNYNQSLIVYEMINRGINNIDYRIILEFDSIQEVNLFRLENLIICYYGIYKHHKNGTLYNKDYYDITRNKSVINSIKPRERYYINKIRELIRWI